MIEVVSGQQNISDLPDVLFIGGTRYSYPLNETHKKKFSALSKVSRNHVFAYSTDGKFGNFFDGANFYLIPSKMPRIIRYPFFLFSALFMIIYTTFRHNVMIVICQSPYEGISAVIAKLILKVLRKNISIITEVHGDWESAPALYLSPKSKLFSRILSRLGRRLSNLTLKNSNVIRSISSFTTEKLSSKFNKPIVEFPTYTDIELFLNSNDDIQKSSLYNNYIFYAGMLIYLKGVHVLIESMTKIVEKYEKQLLLIAGSGEYQKELERLVKERKLEDNIIFLGHLDQRTLSSYMRNCMVLVLPSLMEGLGRVLIEAMACGKPVIGTAVGGIPDLIKDGKNGFLVQPNNSEAIANRIIYLIQNPDVAVKMGINGREFVSATFSTMKYTANFQELIHTAMKYT